MPPRQPRLGSAPGAPCRLPRPGQCRNEPAVASSLDGVWSSTGSESLLGLTGAARMAPYVLFRGGWRLWLIASGGAVWSGRRCGCGLRCWPEPRHCSSDPACRLGYAVVLASAGGRAGTPAYPALMAACPPWVGRFAAGQRPARHRRGRFLRRRSGRGGLAWAGCSGHCVPGGEPGSAPLLLPCAAYASPLW